MQDRLSYQEQRKLEIYKFFKSPPFSLVTDLIKLINSYDSTEQNEAIKTRLIDYINYQKQFKKPYKNTFLGLNFGFSQREKLNAAEALFNYVGSPSAENMNFVIACLGPLQSGRLKKIWDEYATANPVHYREIIEEDKRRTQEAQEASYAGPYRGDTDSERMRGRLSKD